MIKTAFALTAASLLAFSAPAMALTLTNSGEDEIQIEVTDLDSNAVRNISIEPDQTLTELCESSCRLMLQDGTSHDFDGTETVRIQDGEFVIEE
jgi:hypothetical protein